MVEIHSGDAILVTEASIGSRDMSHQWKPRQRYQIGHMVV